MAEYYRQRAPQYDVLYKTPEWREDLAWLKRWVAHRTARRSVLEVAAGTGFWTKAAAAAATAVTATDCNPEVLALASKRRLGRHVTFAVADAYALPKFDGVFAAGMAHLWWSHVDKRREHQFLRDFTSRLVPGAELVMIDQLYVDGYSMPAFRRDRAGNRYELRSLGNGRVFQVIKNYPTPEQLQASMNRFCEGVQITCLRYFWALRGRVRG
jgi:ubiquinone/menaquinone biosynthesis C-methylase UbiE